MGIKLRGGERTYVMSDGHNGSPLCSTGHWPFGAAAQKGERKGKEGGRKGREGLGQRKDKGEVRREEARQGKGIGAEKGGSLVKPIIRDKNC